MSREHATLEEKRDEDEDFTRLCQTPCQARATIGARYRLAGPGLVATDDATVPGEGMYLARANLGTTSVRTTKLLGIIGGGSLMGLGGMVTLVSGMGDGPLTSDQERQLAVTRVIGISVFLAGAAAMIAGLLVKSDGSSALENVIGDNLPAAVWPMPGGRAPR